MVFWLEYVLLSFPCLFHWLFPIVSLLLIVSRRIIPWNLIIPTQHHCEACRHVQTLLVQGDIFVLNQNKPPCLVTKKKRVTIVNFFFYYQTRRFQYEDITLGEWSLGFFPLKDMQTPPPLSEMTPSFFDCIWCAMFWIERECEYKKFPIFIFRVIIENWGDFFRKMTQKWP